MSDMRAFLCWSPSDAANLIHTEAVSPDRSVFLATHTALKIRRGAADGRYGDEHAAYIDEEAVKDEFLSRPTTNGVLLMPVIGESGTGKSHLVRWIWEKTQESPDRRRHVIYLPKTGTSLRAVVDALLKDAQGDEFEQLRADVRRVGAELDQAGLQQRLLNQLQEALAAAPPPSGPARVLTGPKGLGVLLLDPHLRERYLLQPGHLIPRLAAQLLQDRRHGETDRPMTFTAGDLPLSILDATEASAAAQKLISMLQSQEQMQSHAVELLNRHLDVAVMNAVNLGVGRLHRAMLEVRREYARQGKEIVLLIEDFALIQCVQRDLLEAVIEAGVRGGRTQYAPIRTLMAVTTGYYTDRLVDTVQTRMRAATPFVYSLDLPPAQPDDINNFAGRYLNLVRNVHKGTPLDGGQIRNICSDCPVQPQCHSAFGTSTEEIGLYPFNASALQRLTRSVAAPGNDPHAFNPRVILGVLRDVLVERSAGISDGSFPDARLRKEYPAFDLESALGNEVKLQITEHDPCDAERRMALLEIWGNAPSTLVNLAAPIHEAFQLPLLDLSGSEPVAKREAEIPATAQQAESKPVGLRKSVQAQIAEIEEWAALDKPIGENTARVLRTIISQAVAERCTWNDPLIPMPLTKVIEGAWRPTSTVVSIEGALAENAPGTANAPIKFKRTAGNSVFFQGLLAVREGKIEGHAAAVRRLSEVAARHQPDFMRAIQEHLSVTDQALVYGLRASILGAALAGVATPAMNQSELLAAAFDSGAGWPTAGSATRTTAWNTVLDSHLEGRHELITGLRSGFGISRGSGSVRTIDAARVLPLLDRAIHDWAWTPPEVTLPQWMRKAAQRLAAWDGLVDSQIEYLCHLRDQIRTLLPAGAKPMAAITEVRAALEDTGKVGHGPLPARDGFSLEEFRIRLNEAEHLEWRTFDTLDRDLDALIAGEGGRNARIRAAVRDRGNALPAGLQFLQTANSWLDRTLTAVGLQKAATTDDAAELVNALTRRWTGIASGGIG